MEQKAVGSDRPVISVCMPVYNGSAFVRETIESVLAQSYKNFEFLVMDDGSTDASAELVRSYADQDSRVTLFQGPNRGVSRSRNLLLAEAQGEFIAVIDSDDVALPNRLKDQLDFMQQNPDINWLGGAFELIDERGRYLTTMSLAADNASIQNLLLKGSPSLLHSAALIRKDVMEQLGGYRESFSTAGSDASDLDLWLRMTEIGAVANLPQTIVKYRIHSKSISARSRQKQLDHADRAVREAWERRGLGVPAFKATGCPYRPLGNRASRHEFMLKYGWWAFNSRQRGTAAYYGMRAAVEMPFALESWQLFFCAVFKRLPKQAGV